MLTRENTIFHTGLYVRVPETKFVERKQTMGKVHGPRRRTTQRQGDDLRAPERGALQVRRTRQGVRGPAKNRGEMVAECNSGGKMLEDKMATTPKEEQMRIKQEAMDVQATVRDRLQKRDANVSWVDPQEVSSVIEIDGEGDVKGAEKEVASDSDQEWGAVKMAPSPGQRDREKRTNARLGVQDGVLTFYARGGKTVSERGGPRDIAEKIREALKWAEIGNEIRRETEQEEQRKAGEREAKERVKRKNERRKNRNRVRRWLRQKEEEWEELFWRCEERRSSFVEAFDGHTGNVLVVDTERMKRWAQRGLHERCRNFSEVNWEEIQELELRAKQEEGRRMAVVAAISQPVSKNRISEEINESMRREEDAGGGSERGTQWTGGEEDKGRQKQRARSMREKRQRQKFVGGVRGVAKPCGWEKRRREKMARWEAPPPGPPGNRRGNEMN